MVKSLISPLWNRVTAGRQSYSKVAEKGRAARGGFPRAALVACCVNCLLYLLLALFVDCLLITSFYVDLVVS